MLCPNCETQNDDGARLCVECGFPLSGAVSRGAGAISPAKSTAPYQKHHDQSQARSMPIIMPNPAVSAAEPHRSYPQQQSFQNGYSARAQEFSWDAPAQEGNPARGLFEPTGPFDPVDPASIAHETSQLTGRIQQPQIIQVDLQGRELKPDTTQQMHPIEETSAQDHFEDPYGYTNDPFATELLDPMNGDYPPAYEDPYAAIQEPAYAQDDFDAFYQGETTLHVDTMKFDDDRPTARSSRSYTNNRAKASKGSSKSVKREKRTVSQRNYRIPQKKQGLSGKQRGLVIGGIVAVVAALVLVIGFAFGIWGGVPVPNVENMSQSEAVKILEENGFKTKIVQVKSDEIEGRVLSTEPHAGSFAEEGSEIVVNIAVARTIPDVVGMNYEKAIAVLEESGYTNIKRQVEKSNGVEDMVISSTPSADTRAKSTMEITLVVSENYKVPDISGMSYDQAVAAIREAGLVASVIYIDTDQYPDGTIIGSDPEAGTRVNEGSTVGINIARMRGVELNALATQLLSAGNTVTVQGVSYQVESLTSLSYQGNDAVAFTFQGKPYVEFFGETLFASSSQTVSGTIQYNSANDIVSIT